MSSEEANARALLLAMQARLADNPYAALGIPSHASASDIRSAFLQLTKTYHPARFGRMAVEIQKLSNEVFLALKAAHDALAKPRPSGRTGAVTGVPANRPMTKPFGVPITPTRPGGVARPERLAERSGAMPPAADPRSFDPPTQPPQRHSQPLPTKPGSTPPPTLTRQPPSSSSAPANRPMGARAVTPATGVPSRPTPNPPAGTRTAGNRSSQPIRFPPVQGRPATPTPGAQVAQRSTPSGSGQAIDRELAPIFELLGMGMWDAAQAAVDALSAKHPSNKRYEAFACYARGRRAQLEGRFDDARVELGRSLMLDPDLEPAKIANAELFAQRRR